MPILKKFTKQPGELQDYDVFFDDYVDPLQDSLASVHSATADEGITLVSYSRTGDMVKLWFEGGTDGQDYNAQVTCLTTGGRRRQADILIKVREVGRAS